MDKIEKAKLEFAIDFFETIKPNYNNIFDVFDLAIQALQEKQQRDQMRCENCDLVKPSGIGREWRYCCNGRMHHRKDHFCGYFIQKKENDNDIK